MNASFDFPHHLFTPVKPLGRGSSGIVLLGEWRNKTTNEVENVVMKFCNNPSPCIVGQVLLKYLRHRGNAKLRSKIPAVHRDAMKELFEPMKKCCTVFRDQYQHLKPEQFTMDVFLELLDILQQLHRYE